MNPKKLEKDVMGEIRRVIKKTGMDITQMSEEKRSAWVAKLVKKYSE